MILEPKKLLGKKKRMSEVCVILEQDADIRQYRIFGLTYLFSILFALPDTIEQFFLQRRLRNH